MILIFLQEMTKNKKNHESCFWFASKFLVTPNKILVQDFSSPPYQIPFGYKHLFEANTLVI